MKRTDVIDHDFYRELLKINDWIAFRDLFFRFFILLSLLSISFYFLDRSFFISILFYYISSVVFGFFGYAGIGHELFHGRVFSNRKLNRLLFLLFSFILWNNPYFFSKSHAIHHSKTFSGGDLESKSIQDWSYFSILMYVTVDFIALLKKISYAVINSIGFMYVGGELKRVNKEIKRMASFILLSNLIIQVVLYFLFSNFLVNIIFLLMPFTGQIFNRILAQSQHIGLSGLAHKGPLYHSRTIILPRFLEFLYASMNYHAEHHYAPAIPYYNLRSLNAYLKQHGLDRSVGWLRFFSKEFFVLVIRPT